nr:U-scoloptoxin(16)-Er13a [Crassostrea gigas]
MTVLKLALLFGAYGSLILIPMSKGAYISYRGECPDGHKEGDTWPWGDYCGECSCHVGYWACVSCGSLMQAEHCYHESNTHAHYPNCCPSLVCVGDPHFNQTKYDILGK